VGNRDERLRGGGLKQQVAASELRRRGRRRLARHCLDQFAGDDDLNGVGVSRDRHARGITGKDDADGSCAYRVSNGTAGPPQINELLADKLKSTCVVSVPPRSPQAPP
jgi:hypothetical protein